MVFAYPTRAKFNILNGYSLRVEAGQMVALCGPSGSGKSTIISLIERFYDPQSGQVLLDGADIKTLNVRWLREQIGLVGQEPVLFTGTVAENIMYGKTGATQADVEEAAKLANAHEGIAEVYFEQGELAKGEAHLDTAIDIRRRAQADSPDHVLFSDEIDRLVCRKEELARARDHRPPSAHAQKWRRTLSALIAHRAHEPPDLGAATDPPHDHEHRGEHPLRRRHSRTLARQGCETRAHTAHARRAHGPTLPTAPSSALLRALARRRTRHLLCETRTSH